MLSDIAGRLYLLLSALISSPQAEQRLPGTSQQTPLSFQLRHIHAVTASQQIIFHDVVPELVTTAHSTLKGKEMKVYKPRSNLAFQRARWRSLMHGESEALDWDEDTVTGPDTEDRETLLELAKMTSNAYVSPSDPLWYNLTDKWANDTIPVGWEPDDDGFRGHIFTSTDNSTVVLAIKGTSANVVGGGGPTSKKDKINDNLLFSCCCARVDWTWTTVCDCYDGGWRCDAACLDRSLQEESLFYPVGTNLYNNITYMYPNANIWLVGHSLGGALASLLGITFGLPVVAFESPGERMAARRLHLPLPPSIDNVLHVYHTADIIAMGNCNGVLSSCAIGGYAMESRCHLGRTALYDTIGKRGWSADIRTHRIAVVINELLSKDWEDERPLPVAEPENDCVECYGWEFGDFKHQLKNLSLS